MALMIHKIHTGHELKVRAGYTVVGNGGAVHPFDHVGYSGVHQHRRSWSHV
jgi:hypothetical protein